MVEEEERAIFNVKMMKRDCHERTHSLLFLFFVQFLLSPKAVEIAISFVQLQTFLLTYGVTRLGDFLKIIRFENS